MKNLVTKLLNVRFDFPISEETCNVGLFVSYDGRTAKVAGESKPALARAYTLLAKAISEGKTSFEIKQTASFDVCGAMLDMSFGSVTKVDGVKRYLEYMVLFGMNMLMLYTEDTYEVEGYPLFGYQRGRYTLEELREIDDYAASLGVEVIPCIQTFGHLKNFLRYSVHKNIAENATVLLPGDEKTYQFIEACIATNRKAFRTNRIHIGCDETHGVGFGKSYIRDGYREPFEVYNAHVNRVVDICHKFGYQPMMWSDMYTTLSKKADGTLGEIPQYALDTMPNADMVFWNYYNLKNEFYHDRLALHQKFHRKTIFAGGIWTWNGHAPNFQFTYDTVRPAMEECLRFGVREVFGTGWAYGDINHLQATPCLAVYSEYCWLGNDCTKEAIDEIAAFITKMPKEYCDAVGNYYCGEIGDRNVGKLFFWSDPLLNLMPYHYDIPAYEACIEHSLSVFEKYPDAPYCEYYKAVFRCVLKKMRLQRELYRRYQDQDREWMENLANFVLPEMLIDFETVYRMHDDLWHRDHKTHGFEKLSNYYGSAMERIRYLQRTLLRYLNGEISEIEALENEPIAGEVEQRFLAARHVMNSYLD